MKNNARKHMFKPFLALVLVLCCIAGGILMALQTEPVFSDGAVTVSVSRRGISIENEYLSVEYAIAKRHINMSAITNKRIDGGRTIEMMEGTEDFVIRLFDEDAPSAELNKTGWSITVRNGDGTEFPLSDVALLIDGSTFVHPQIADSSYVQGPFTIDLDLGSEQVVSSIGIDKRSGDCEEEKSLNGTMGRFQLYVSEDGINYVPAGEGEFTEASYNLHSGAGFCASHFAWHDYVYNMGERAYANFDQTYTTRYVRLVQESCLEGTADDCFSSTELTLYADPYGGTGVPDVEKSTIMASELTYASAEVEAVEDGKKLTIHYRPFRANGCTYNIDQVVTLGDSDFYLRSHLEIQTSDKDKSRIDYIDTNRLVLPEDTEDIWEEGIGAIGQPLYAGGLFMGSEFPAAYTWIDRDNMAQSRWYSGKSFARMEADGQLTDDGRLVTWPNVIGASWDTNIKVVQSDFYQYIEEIATPTEFRKQYNTWFTFGRGITDEKIEGAFLGVEKGLTQNGIGPLDCYVIDDGWNSYFDGLFLTEPGENEGMMPNATGFWEINDKFANDMYPSSALVSRLQSTFGMWMSPQGGYNYDKTFSQFLEYSGTGYVRAENTGNGTIYPSFLCTAADKYMENLRYFLLDYDTRFDITYWKMDGLGGTCQDFGHGHMTGGYLNMYYVTDMWEKWISLFEDIRAAREAEGREMFINATNGTVLSPWILQWVNTVWLNRGGDEGTLGTGEHYQQMIYYRDQSYYSLFGGERQIQFPLGHLYNHDPICTSRDVTPETFREYLFANAMRGTAIWEMYFTPSIMEDTYWKIASDVLTWAEENHEVLGNARYFGNDPAEGVYGYSCFSGNRGIISFTNPLDEAQTYTLHVDGTAGADKDLNGAVGFQVLPYEERELGTLTYGDTVTVELDPHQTVIWQYGVIDTDAPTIVSARSEGDDKIIVKFSERVYLDRLVIDGILSDASLQADYRTVVLQAEESLAGTRELDIRVRDMSGNVYESPVTVICYGENNTIIDVAGAGDLLGAEDISAVRDEASGMSWMDGIDRRYEVLTDNELTGSEPFAICTGIQTEGSDMDLVIAGDDVRLWIDQSGYIRFTVGDVTLTSQGDVTSVTQKAHGVIGTFAYVPVQTETVTVGNVNDGRVHAVAAVREANGMLKLYLDGELCASAYDEERPNQKLSGGAITVADDAFRGRLAEVFIFNKALGYDEVRNMKM